MYGGGASYSCGASFNGGNSMIVGDGRATPRPIGSPPSEAWMYGSVMRMP
jgi:hypothetical protein